VIDLWMERTLDALGVVARVYRVSGDFKRLKASNAWGSQAR
jgi:hypothetical protein